MAISYADVFDAVAEAVQPQDAAVICDGVALPWSEFSGRTNAFARTLIGRGLKPGAKVAQYMRNSPDYAIAFVGAFKARMAPVNVNYRYGPDELHYLFDNSDAEVVVFDVEFVDAVRVLKPRLPRVVAWVASGGTIDGFETLDAFTRVDGSRLDIERSPDDMFLLYTGGTTGLPKGVMWPGGVWWDVLAPGRAPQLGQEPPATLEALKAQIRAGLGRDPVYVAPPLMHGTGMFTAFGAISKGAPLVLSRSVHFDPVAALDEMTRLRCGGLTIVGDAFAKPILDTLQADPARFDVSGMRVVTSSGMMWSPAVKRGLLEFMQNASLYDSFGASEATGLGVSVTTASTAAEDAKFEAPNTIVVRAEDFTPITPGSGEVGLVAKWGNLPLGYYKDPEKTARTYVTINGVRHLISGDHATVEADGKIRLLGRGSNCINSGGEKIYPEEVEEALKTHASVVDALVFGQPDPRFGQSVSAVVEANPGGSPSESELIDHVRRRLAHYKAPRHIVLTRKVPRAPNGKPDYATARAMFEASLQSD